MPTQAEIERAFRVYFEEMDRCVKARCYWALLHLVLVFPDICGALEGKDGKATGERHQRWCSRNLKSSRLSPDEWWELRCIVLHEGRTLARRGRYQLYVFGQPDCAGKHDHAIVKVRRGKHLMELNVDAMAKEVKSAIRRWAGQLEGLHTSRTQHVDENLKTLVRLHSDAPLAVIGISAAAFHKTSSP